MRRLGATRGEPVDVWIIAATSEDLEAGARERRFRADLYHRLAVITVRLPALRQRCGRHRAARRAVPPRGVGRHGAAAADADRGRPRRPPRVRVARQHPRAEERHHPRRAPHRGLRGAGGRPRAPDDLDGEGTASVRESRRRGGGGVRRPGRDPAGPDRAGASRHGMERLARRGAARAEPEPAPLSDRQARPGPRAAGRLDGARDVRRRVTGASAGRAARAGHEPDRPGAGAPRDRPPPGRASGA